MHRIGVLVSFRKTLQLYILYLLRITCRHSYDGDVDIDSYEKEGSDISSLYVSMYKRDYYIHDDNNNEQSPTSATKIIPTDRKRHRSILLKTAPVSNSNDSELKEKVGWLISSIDRLIDDL